jgi:hypothetical protein
MGKSSRWTARVGRTFVSYGAGRGNLPYAAFDGLRVNGKDLRGLPLSRRKRALMAGGLVPIPADAMR